MAAVASHVDYRNWSKAVSADMCGIAGYVATAGAGPDVVIERMTARLTHRGPDDSGFYRDGFAHLGHRRLSIIDLAAGRQPMTSETGDRWVVYNGEIFNHAEIRTELEAAGHRYVSRCDTETILHAYEEYGAACPRRFRGMFAFAVWDARTRTLFCARDRLGIKPFYYWWDGRVFVFASEMKALLEHPAVAVRANQRKLGEYLAFGYISDEETLFAGIRKLPPGHTLSLAVDHGRLEVVRYWDVPAPQDQQASSSEADWIAECRARLETTVRMRLMSDVPLGMFLSGGVDSSLIAALMRRMVSGPVQTFAVGYREAAYSELGFAREVARHLGTEHHEITIGKEDFFEALPRLIWHEDEPIAWPSSVSLYFVAKLAAERVKVVLTGEGADELFAGYARYAHYLASQRWLPVWRRVPAGLRRALREQIHCSPLLPAGARRKLEHTFLGRGETLESLYLDNFYAAFPAEERAALGVDGDAMAPFQRYWQEGAARGLLDRLLYADQKTYLVELLMKQDQMSMAASLESRVPFLDHPLVEFAARAPVEWKLRGRTGKYLLKKVAEEFLPAALVHRRKMGFPTPLRDWLREPATLAALGARILQPRGFLAGTMRMEAFRPILERHQRGNLDATDRIWRLLNLQVWAEVFLDGRRADAPAAPPLLGAACTV